jgi:hypothetical protein
VKTQIFILLFLLAPYCWAEENLPQNWLETAQFNKNEVLETSLPIEKSHHLGLVAPNFSGYGVVFRKDLSARSSLWTIASYTNKEKLFTESSSTPTSPAFSEMEERKNYQLLFGYDFLVRNPWSRFWTVLVGVGAGVHRSKKIATHYENEVCVFVICGVDTKSPTFEERRELYFSVSPRIGLHFTDVKLWGITADTSFVASPFTQRLKKERDWISPQGRKVDYIKFTPFFVEVNFRI